MCRGLEAWRRLIVGWAMAAHLRTGLVLEALNMALWQRRPEDVIHHSDQGCQYTSLAFGRRCREAGVRPSMGSAGDCYDNALCESFFATLECELIERCCFPTHAVARRELFDFIEGWYLSRIRDRYHYADCQIILTGRCACARQAQWSRHNHSPLRKASNS